MYPISQLGPDQPGADAATCRGRPVAGRTDPSQSAVVKSVVSRKENLINSTSDQLERIQRQRRELGDQFPRFALFFAACDGADHLRSLVDALSPALREVLAGAYAYLSPSAAHELATSPPAWDKVAVLRDLRNGGFEATYKIGLKHAIEQKFDYVIVAGRGDAFDPGALPPLLAAALFDQAGVAVGVTRPMGPTPHREARLGQTLNTLLHLTLSDHRAAHRLYATAVLRDIPFAEDADGPELETQLLIQSKILRQPIVEVPLPCDRAARPPWRWRERLRILQTTVGYRLHQLHLWRHGRWLVDFGEKYTFKSSPLGSHRQILDAIATGSRVLDLGCSQGLLAHELAKKGCHVVGVDQLPPERVKLPYERYVQANLDDPALALPFGREFDVVILADVIEHLVHREAVMELVRRHLVEEGRLIISTANIAIWFYRISLLLGRFEYSPRGILDETHVRLFTHSTFERLVRMAGFEIIGRRTTPLPFEIVFQTHAANPFIRFLDTTYHFLTRLWPALFAYQFILEARIARLETGEAPVWPPAKSR